MKDFLALERALSFIMLSIQISILQLFLSFCFCLSFFSSNEFYTRGPFHLALRGTTEHVFPDLKDLVTIR